MSAIAIFVKTPGISAVKTRLAATVGPELATALYRHCAAAVAEAADQANVGKVYWASAEPARQVERRWPDLPLIEQGVGGLGERMHRILSELVRRHGSGLLLGADAPQLDPVILHRAADWLQGETPRRIIGPARDGGFWTFGANHVPPLEFWTRVPYSRPDTLQEFRNSIGDDAAWLELATLTDLDTKQDMSRVAEELTRLKHPMPAQKHVLHLLQTGNRIPDP